MTAAAMNTDVSNLFRSTMRMYLLKVVLVAALFSRHRPCHILKLPIVGHSSDAAPAEVRPWGIFSMVSRSVGYEECSELSARGGHGQALRYQTYWGLSRARST